MIVDAANVVGSVPDGWWRDRYGAAERLRDALVPYAGQGVAGQPGPLDVVLVVEGAARGVGSVPGVRVEAAEGSGDDLIVELAARAAAEGAGCLVVTADRELRRRVAAHGARCAGPRTVRQRPGPVEGDADADAGSAEAAGPADGAGTAGGPETPEAPRPPEGPGTPGAGAPSDERA